MKKTENEVIKGVIYARYSSAGQREESIEGQIRECSEFAKRYGITIVGQYCDKALTGTSDKRPEFQRMIRDSSKGQFSVVVCWKNDRFARSRYDAAIYKYKLKNNGVRILYAKESIPDGPEGIILESVMEGYAEYYSANLAQNVKRGFYDSALKRQTLGCLVYGLKPGPDKRWMINEEQAPIVRRIFEEYAAGRPAKDIYQDLNAEGYRTVRGGPFNKNSLRRILQNEKYIGVYEYEDIRDEQGIPPIIDRALFDKVQIMIEKHHRSPAATKTDGGFLLTCKLFCGHCGEPMTGDGGTSHTGKVYAYYTCNGRRKKKCDKERAPKEWIEDLVVHELAKAVQSDEMIDAFADKFIEWQERQQGQSVLTSLEQRRKQNEAAVKNVMALIDGGFVTDSVKSHLLELEAEKVDIERGIAKELLQEPELDRDAVVYFLSKFRDGDIDDPGWRIYLVETFLKAAYLYDDGRLLLQLNFCGDKSEISVQIAEDAVKYGDEVGSNFAPSGAASEWARRTKVRGAHFVFVQGKCDGSTHFP